MEVSWRRPDKVVILAAVQYICVSRLQSQLQKDYMVSYQSFCTHVNNQAKANYTSIFLFIYIFFTYYPLIALLACPQKN